LYKLVQIYATRKLIIAEEKVTKTVFISAVMCHLMETAETSQINEIVCCGVNLSICGVLRSFRYASPIPCNQLSSFCQPHSVHSPPGSSLTLHISPHHRHHLRSHHLSFPRPFTLDLKLISFTNSFLHSLSDSFQTAFTDPEPVQDLPVSEHWPVFVF